MGTDERPVWRPCTSDPALWEGRTRYLPWVDYMSLEECLGCHQSRRAAAARPHLFFHFYLDCLSVCEPENGSETRMPGVDGGVR